MPRIAPRFVDEVLARADIVDIVGSRIPLKHTGREWSARCPFHDERSASFYVSPQKQFFHCFGCGAHGSAIGFVMQYDGVEFIDAVETLAQHLGLAVQYDAGRKLALELSDQLYPILAEASQWFRAQLTQATDAQQYLSQRGIDRALQERYAVGWAPGGAMQLSQALARDPASREALAKVGLTGTARGEQSAKFFSRVMFPIRDRRGRPIAFGGRVIDQGEPKYLNSPESPLFHKGRQLYGLYEARQANSKLSRLVVVEGYLDVISLAQHGVTDAVATLGTATTVEHAELLFRSVPDVYFCFDGDRAGRQAAWRALTNVLPRLTEGRQAFFMFLPDGEDPDSLVRKHGADGFSKQLGAALPLSEYLFRELRQQCDSHTLEGRAKLVSLVRPLLQSAPDSAYRDLLLGELERISGSKVQLQANESRAASGAAPTKVWVQPAPGRTLIRHLLSCVLSKPDLAAQTPDLSALLALGRPGIDVLLRVLEVARTRPGLNTAALLEAMSEDPASASLGKVAMLDPPGDPEGWAHDFMDGLQRLLDEVCKLRISELQALIESDTASAAQRTELRQLLLRPQLGKRRQS